MIKQAYIIIIKFITFFCMNAFVISCSFLLFLHDMKFTEEQIQMNAKLTLLNIIILSVLFVIIDICRQKILIDRPINRIHAGLSKIRQGNFNTVIEPLSTLENTNGFNTLIDHINEVTHELNSVETLRNDFISNVSHELKTPLSIIQNYSVLIQDKSIDENKKIEYAKNIQNTTRRLSELVSNILKLNKLENQKIYPNSKKYNLSEQLCECILQYENIWESKHIEMTFDLQEDVMIYADQELLSIVWNNLLSNALKFTDEYGKVFVGCKVEGNNCIVTFMDNGCGMSNETGRHIFDKFYQQDSSRLTVGNGLGLALVKKVVELMNAEIRIQSELGRGSVFEVHLEIMGE